MVTISDNAPEEGGRDEEEPDLDFWSDDGAKRFNEALDEGRVYAQTRSHLSDHLEMYFEDEEREYKDPELCEPDEETLPPGEMELIFENSYIM